MPSSVFTVISICIALCFLRTATAQTVEKISSNESGHWVVEGHEISAEMRCSISRSFLLPRKDCSQPYMVIRRTSGEKNVPTKTFPYFHLAAGKISIGNKAVFDEKALKEGVSFADMLSTGVVSQTSGELFTLLMVDPNTLLTVKTRSSLDTPIRSRSIVLANFEATASGEIRKIHERYGYEAAAARRDTLFGLGILGAALASSLWLILFLVKRARIRLKAATQKNELKRVDRIAEDEIIRVAVRSRVQELNGSELDVLRNQIRAALDAGDTETAEKLLNVLKKSTK